MCIELYIIISSEWVADILGCQLHIGQLWSVVYWIVCILYCSGQIISAIISNNINGHINIQSAMLFQMVFNY